MSTELTIAIGLLATAIIGTVTWFVQYLPKYIQGKIEAERQAHTEQIESEKAEREGRITELKARVEQTDKLVEQIARGNDVNERLINNIVEIAKEQSTGNKVIAANTSAITGNTEALGDLNKTVEQVKADVVIVKQDIKDLREFVEKRLPNPVDCVDVTEQLNKFEEKIINLFESKQPSNIIDATEAIKKDEAA